MKNSFPILFWLLSCVPVQASDFALFGGWNLADDLKRGTKTVSLQDFSVVGVRYEKDFLFILGFENTFAYNRKALVPEAGQYEDEDAVYYSANFVFNFPNFPATKVFPYVTVGLGVFHRFGDAPPDAGTAFLTNWGAGIKFRNLAGPVGFRVDYRRLTIHDVLDKNVTNDEISAGLLISF